jgi:putative ABC transport system permease protein
MMNNQKDKSPPRLALRFLAWFCPPRLYEGIEDDLVERFEEDFVVAQYYLANSFLVL